MTTADQSVRQDRFTPLAGSSGSSSANFRSLALQPREIEQDAAARAFFDQQRAQHAGSPFAMDGLRKSLPPSQPPPAWANDFMRHSQNSSPAPGAMSERAWEKSRMLDTASSPMPAWATDFSRQLQTPSPAGVATPPSEVQHAYLQQPQHGLFIPQISYAQAMPMQMQHWQPPIQQQPAFQEAGPRIQEIDASVQTSNWESAFMQHLAASPAQASQTAPATQEDAKHPVYTARPVSPTLMPNRDDGDLLSRTAGELLNNVSHDLQSNDKMRNSSFMRLMQKLRDKEVTVEGDQMVDKAASSQVPDQYSNLHRGDIDGPSYARQSAAQGSNIPVEFKSSGAQPVCVLPLQASLSANDTVLAQSSQTTQTAEDLSSAYDEMNAALDGDLQARQDRAKRAFQGDGGAQIPDVDDMQPKEARQADTAVPGASQAWEEDFDFDNELLRSGPAPPTMQQTMRETAQQQEWADLQGQWDSIASTSTGLQAANLSPLASYPFHTRNPYMLSSQHRSHLPENTLLSREAEVQENPLSPQAWLNLGLKQQENEREALAIQALQRALELDSGLQQAWLALAVSYTNDNVRGKAYDAIDKWVACKPEYEDLVARYRQLNGPGGREASQMLNSQRHAYLTGMLVEMARAGMAQVDADVQIALGVLFNASEEYEKAADCFSAALSVRPSDPHLYNRLGATMANSGKAETAIEYYNQALSLQPDFARATYVLSSQDR